MGRFDSRGEGQSWNPIPFLMCFGGLLGVLEKVGSVQFMVRHIARTAYRISRGVAKRVAGNFYILVKVTRASAGGVTSGVVQGLLKVHVFNSRGKGAGLSLRSVRNSLLLVSRFALCTSYQGKGHPSFVGTKGPRLTGGLCRCVVTGYGKRVPSMRAKVFNTSVGVSLMGSKPFAVLLSSRSLTW